MTEHTLPSGATIHDVRKVYEAWEAGDYNLDEMSQEFGLSRETIRRYVSRPEKYDPYIDEIAVDRAVNGDRPVFENLTVWERHEFEERIAGIADSLDEHSGMVPSSYMRYLAQRLGLGDDTLYRKYLKRNQAMRGPVGRASAA